MRNRFFLILSLIMVLSLSVNAFAAESGIMDFSRKGGEVVEEDQTTETTQASQETGTAADKNESTAADASTKAQAENSGDDSYEKVSSDSDPIGDNGAYYGLEDLGGSPDIVAESSVVMDASTGHIIFAKQADVKRYPASITKVMTALLAIENCSMDDEVEYTQEILDSIEAGSSSAGIPAGAKISMEDSLYALMLMSANESGAAIAVHIAGSDEEFAKMMTARAKELGCENTTFKNPHGLPDEEHVTTAHDMGLIVREAIKSDTFRTIAGTHEYTIASNDTMGNPIELHNHAKILYENSEYYYQYVQGAKTGFTQAALNTLVTYASKDDLDLICVILKDSGANNSYYDTRNLYEWAYDSVKQIRPAASFDVKEAIKKDKSIKKKVKEALSRAEITFNADYPILVMKDFDESTVSCRFVYDRNKKTGRIGYINMYTGDTLIGAAPVKADLQDGTEAASNGKGKGGSDDLDAASVDDNKLSVKKILFFFLKVLIAIALIIVIMQFIRSRDAERRRKNRIKQRRKDHLTDKETSGKRGRGRSRGKHSR